VRAGDVVRDAINASVERFLANEDAVTAGAAPEAVHQARVATRRLRSDLKTFEDFVDREWASQLRTELQWMGGELGQVRDIEVMLERLRADAAELPDNQCCTAERLIRRLIGDWEAARNELLAAIDSPRYARVVELLHDAAAEPHFTPRADTRADEALAPVVRTPWKKLRKAVDDLGKQPSDTALHGVRIRTKRCRYATEATAAVYGNPARKFAVRLAALQDLLGEHQDAVVAQIWLEHTSRDCDDDEALAAKLLAERQARAAVVARTEFTHAWRAVRRRRPSTWL
jgi:CHAD domain-containing protein